MLLQAYAGRGRPAALPKPRLSGGGTDSAAGFGDFR